MDDLNTRVSEALGRFEREMSGGANHFEDALERALLCVLDDLFAFAQVLDGANERAGAVSLAALDQARAGLIALRNRFNGVIDRALARVEQAEREIAGEPAEDAGFDAAASLRETFEQQQAGEDGSAPRA